MEAVAVGGVLSVLADEHSIWNDVLLPLEVIQEEPCAWQGPFQRERSSSYRGLASNV